MTTSSTRVQRVLERLEIPEGVRVEIIFGEILLSPSSDLATNLIVASLLDQIPYGKWHGLTKQSLSFPGDVGEPQPDLVVFERGPVEELPAAAVTLVVEVVTKPSALRDHRTKRELYAQGGIPAYLIVDPLKAVCVLLTEPTRASVSGLPDYTVMRTVKFGEPIPVDLLDVTLDTSEFQAYS
ncbi:Uma2 family endonuclease [Kitasatospora sp. NPDC098652]|uniref:Uma2 family endonuclease n=1 Tax=Kitasatospora sp. NPDC098652 TaxID=3364095 RepID=UPI00382FFFBD